MSTQSLSYSFPDEIAFSAFAAHLAHCMQQGIVFLQGDLGAGKTTFVRGFLRELGFRGKIKSPTYTLVETYEIPPLHIHHFDLYRLNDPKELLVLGFAEYAEKDALCFIEWPEKGIPHLPQADLIVQIDFAEPGRRVTLTAHSEMGRMVLEKL